MKVVIGYINREYIDSWTTECIYDSHPLATQLAACRTVFDVIKLFGDNRIVSVQMALPKGGSCGP